MLQVGAVLRHLTLSLANLGLQYLQLSFRHILFVQRHHVIFLGVVERGGGNYAVAGHALGAIIRAFQQRNVRTLGIDLGAQQIGARAFQTGG